MEPQPTKNNGGSPNQHGAEGNGSNQAIVRGRAYQGGGGCGWRGAKVGSPNTGADKGGRCTSSRDLGVPLPHQGVPAGRADPGLKVSTEAEAPWYGADVRLLLNQWERKGERGGCTCKCK